MNKIVQDKMQREIMVVKNEALFKDLKRETKFYKSEEVDFEEIILEQYEFMVREQAEVNTAYKQPIPYGVILNKQNEIFVYKRGSANSNAGDSRFHELISIGIGGHIEREDEDSDNLLQDALEREIEEEMNIQSTSIIETEVIGYINDDSAILHEVHIGIIYISKVSNSNYELLDGELEKGEFKSIEEYENMCGDKNYDVENWSRTLLEPLKDYLLK